LYIDEKSLDDPRVHQYLDTSPQQKIVPIPKSIEKDPSLLIMMNEIYSPL
jgi:hypothetical protein